MKIAANPRARPAKAWRFDCIAKRKDAARTNRKTKKEFGTIRSLRNEMTTAAMRTNAGAPNGWRRRNSSGRVMTRTPGIASTRGSCTPSALSRVARSSMIAPIEPATISASKTWLLRSRQYLSIMSRTVLQLSDEHIGRADEIDLILEDEAKSRLRPTRWRSRARTVGACPENTIHSATSASCSGRGPKNPVRGSPDCSPGSGGKADEQALALERQASADRLDDRARGRRAEVFQVLGEHDRRRFFRDRRDLHGLAGGRDLDPLQRAVAHRAQGEPGQPDLDRPAVDVNRCARAPRPGLLAETFRRSLRELERVRLDECRCVAARLGIGRAA